MALAAPDLVKGVLVGIIAVANLHVTTARRHDVTTARRHVPLDDGYVGVV